MIDVAPHDLETIERILEKHVPDCEVRAFGSRVTWIAKSTSDLDLAIIGDKELPRRTLVKLKAEIEESALPFTVDILDWYRISPDFQQHISERSEIIQSKEICKATPVDWRMMKVSEFADVIGGGTPSTKQEDYWNGDIPWLTPKDLSEYQGRYISRGERNISRLGLENSSARLIPKGAILLTSRAPVGYVAIAKNPLATNQGFRSLVVKKGFHPEFIYYLLLNSTEYLRSHAAGSTFQEISGSTLSNLDFLMLPYAEQKSIAQILGTLDDKIELNRRMNETLEAMAQAIFKSWFVDFDPVRAKVEGRDSGLPKHIAELFPDRFEDSELGEISAGWKIVALPEIIEVNPARSLKNGQAAPYLDMANMPMRGHSPDLVVERPFGSGMRFINGDTLVARITPCLENGKTAFVDFLEDGQVGWGSTEYIVLRPKPPLPEEFAYCLARSDEFREFAIQSMTGTSGRQRVPPGALSHFLMIRPPNELAEIFGRIVKPLFTRAHTAAEESRTLAALRDTLLPKLISGELRVPFQSDVAAKGPAHEKDQRT